MPATPCLPLPPADFDFIFGTWRVAHRRLASRLTGCTDWVAFDGWSETRPVLGGFGNIEDNRLMLPDGEVRAAALRSFDASAGTWSIWWLDGRRPAQLDVPVVGRFADGTGRFYADDAVEGRPVRVRFTWQPVDADRAHWAQAFSADGGATWETNWTMAFTRQGSRG